MLVSVMSGPPGSGPAGFGDQEATTMQTIDPIPNDTHAAAEEPETLHVDPTWESR